MSSSHGYIRLSSKRELCDWVKYLAALAVVNGHLFLFGPYDGEFIRFMNIGSCCVALFFFLSGYGLMCSYAAKGASYLRSFFRHRVGRLVVPLIVAYAVTLPVYYMVKGPVDWRLVITTLPWGGPYLRYSWFVTEIMAVYALFYLAMKLKGEINRKVLILSLLVFALMAALFALRLPVWWIISLPGFVMGLIFQRYEDLFSRYFSKGALLAFILVSGALWFCTWQWGLVGRGLLPQYRYEVAAMFLSNMFFVSLICGLISMTGFIPPYCPVIGSYYEVYLLQSCAFAISFCLAESFPSYWIASMAIVMAIGFIQYKLDRRLSGLLDARLVLQKSGDGR